MSATDATQDLAANEPKQPEPDEGPRAAVAERRRAVAEPLLKAKGWSRTKWAAVAGVDRSVVFGYLDGESSPHPESRISLAGALQIAPRADGPLLCSPGSMSGPEKRFVYIIRSDKRASACGTALQVIDHTAAILDRWCRNGF